MRSEVCWTPWSYFCLRFSVNGNSNTPVHIAQWSHCWTELNDCYPCTSCYPCVLLCECLCTIAAMENAGSGRMHRIVMGKAKFNFISVYILPVWIMVSTPLPAVVVFPDVHRSSRDIHQPIQETRFLHGERGAGVPKSQCIRDTTACVSKQFTYKLSSQLHPLFCYCPLLRLCSSSPCLWSLFNGKRLLPVRS